MNLAGQSTYTVTVDTSSRKFKISSNTIGGNNIFQLQYNKYLSTIIYLSTIKISLTLTFDNNI